VRRRFEYDLRKLKERIHILEGFERVFDGLDEAIRIIRKSEGKQDAAVKLMKAFRLDEVQVDAILEMQAVQAGASWRSRRSAPSWPRSASWPRRSRRS
jgi:DNA gyrase/topoisomerase IV subunit A